jgi:hypothetical protein
LLVDVVSLLWYFLFGKKNTMPAPSNPVLEPGRAYRTRELSRWGANAPRLAKRLVHGGQLVRLAHGLFAHPEQGRFGAVPPTNEEIVRAFLNDTPFVFTGHDRWNALGLGTTALSTERIVYNLKRTGTFSFGGRRFRLRRVGFPKTPPPEWFVVDLFEHAEQAGASRGDLATALERALRADRFDRIRLREMSARYGTKRTLEQMDTALAKAVA